MVKDVIFNYQEEDKNAEEFLKDLKAFLLNPLSLQKEAFNLANEFNQLNIHEKESEDFWNEIKDVIEKNYKLKKKEFPLFQTKLRDYEKILINFISDIGKSKGTNETLSAIIGYLLIYSHLTQSQLQKLSGFSRGAISENLNKLVERGFAKKKRLEESKKYEYSIGEDWKEIAQNVSLVKTSGIEEMKDFIQQKYEEVNTDENRSKKGASILSERLEELKVFFDMYEEIIEIIMKSPIIKDLTKNDEN
ncbi:MAG: hypothetical protein BAJALOKI1v1_660014 [Promethearchaeota archaeon]|nr:MAG: hypothetical protein BAJALOKI1v1_660014 [Candidatus Lokiarchaeota archaeon]